MAVSALDTTVGGASANAYVSIDVANQWNADRSPDTLFAAWDAAYYEERRAAILNATRLLDSLVEWTGWVVNDTQALLWPRTGMYYRNGYYIPETTIPDELQWATAEFARQLLATTDRTADNDVDAQSLRRLKAGPIELEFKDQVIPKVVPDAVVYLLPNHWYSRIGGRAAVTSELSRA